MAVFLPKHNVQWSSLLQLAAYRNHESQKKRAYSKRIWDWSGSFTHLVLLSTGGMGPEPTTIYKRFWPACHQVRNAIQQGDPTDPMLTWLSYFESSLCKSQDIKETSSSEDWRNGHCWQWGSPDSLSDLIITRHETSAMGAYKEKGPALKTTESYQTCFTFVPVLLKSSIHHVYP